VTRHGSAPDAKAAAHLMRTLAARPSSVGPRRVDKPLVLYGAGNLGHMAREYLDRLEIPIAAVVDSRPDAHRADTFWGGVPVFGPAEVPAGLRRDALLAVCVATAPMGELDESLRGQGWRDVVPFYDIAEAYRDRHPLGNGWFTGEIGPAEVAAVEQVLARWDDDVSRAHHLQFIAWHALREDWLFDGAPVTTGDRYFIPDVLGLVHEREAFVDVGAHHGEVVRRFAGVVGGRFESIDAIEGDPRNLAVLRAGIEAERSLRDRVRVLSHVVGAGPGRAAFFDGLGYASQLSSLGGERVEVTTLDALQLRPTFLKLHLEGHELAALEGGLETLRRHRPVVATTSYHNRLGLHELPRWLMDHLDGYHFLLRLHSWCGTGAVVYAIPDERRGPARRRETS
jgi:FkbM family methyltransferase